MTSTSTLTQDTDPTASRALEFSELREEAIAYLQRIVGDLWTDYNLHDPGVTLLELLCYGITDIAYRVSFKDEDLFADPPATDAPSHGLFHGRTARYALTNGPVTTNDYRRALLDAFYPQLRNVWLEPISETRYADTKTRGLRFDNPGDPNIKPFQIRGLYRIRALFDHTLAGPAHDATRAELRQRIFEEFHMRRNLAEDCIDVVETPTQPIRVCADIRLAPNANIEETHARIVHQLQNFLNPRIPRRSLAELVNQGYRSEDIFLGPALTNGFILEDDLDRAASIETVRSSDLIAEILKIAEVVAVPRILLNFAGADEDSEEWELPIRQGFEPALSFEETKLRFYKDIIPFDSNLEDAEERLLELRQADLEAHQVPTNEDFQIPTGSWLDLRPYTTLQENLPPIYGCGSRGINRDRSPAALGKAKQLQAFLLVFDQILANYLGQLVNLQHLFSEDPTLRQTLFANAVEDIPELRNLLKSTASQSDATEDEVQTDYENWIQTSLRNEGIERQQRSRILDHLLATFGETFADHVLLHYKSSGASSPLEIIANKSILLSELNIVHPFRAQAHNILDTTEFWNTQNVAGMKRRIERLLGFPNVSRRNLSSVEFSQNLTPENGFNILDYRSEDSPELLQGVATFPTPDEAENAMREATGLAMNPANYRIVRSGEQWTLHLVDTSQPNEPTVAQSPSAFVSQDEALSAVKPLVQQIAHLYSEEGLFILEHLLMRPRDATWPMLPSPRDTENRGAQAWDPYSFRLQIVLPGWGPRLSKPGFRTFVEQTIRKEAPAHLIARICFIGKPQMAQFEPRYRAWLQALATGQDRPQALTELLKSLNTMNTIYPTGVLHDCVDDGDADAAPIILGRTHLGSSDIEE